jgi:hypothetical protein
MGCFRKTDNHNLTAKLDLRRYFLAKYHTAGDGPDVLDCCQDSRLLWSILGREFKLSGYWGLDVKPKKGRLRVDSARVLEQAGLTQNVIDVDTYGSPWRHWLALLRNPIRPMTVFLTIGQVHMGTDRLILESLGLGSLRVPQGIAVKLHDLALRYCLGRIAGLGLIVDALEASSAGHARYLGLRLEPVQTSTLSAAARSAAAPASPPPA